MKPLLITLYCAFILMGCNPHLEATVTIRNASAFAAQNVEIKWDDIVKIPLLNKNDKRSFLMEAAGVGPDVWVRYELNGKLYTFANEQYWISHEEFNTQLNNNEHAYITIYDDYWLFEK